MKKILSFILIATIVLSLSACTSEEKAEVVTVNGEIITQEETDYFRGKLKAEVLNDYIEKYSVEYTEDFWQTEFDGKTPEETLDELALEESIMAKIQLVLMKEEGIYDDISFEGLRQKAEQFNAENKNKEGIVGIKSIQMSQFYMYYLQNGIMELQNIYAEGKLAPTEEEIKEKTKELFSQYKEDADVSEQDYESIAKSKLETEKYEEYILQLREKAVIEKVAQQ